MEKYTAYYVDNTQKSKKYKRVLLFLKLNNWNESLNALVFTSNDPKEAYSWRKKI